MSFARFLCCLALSFFVAACLQDPPPSQGQVEEIVLQQNIRKGVQELDHYITDEMSESFEILSDYLRGKDVAMVGPAPNLVGTGLGPEIDSYDIVCRVNNSFIISEEMVPDYGTKKDILFNSASELGLQVLEEVWPQWQGVHHIILPGIHQHYVKDHETVLEGMRRVNMNGIPIFQPQQAWFFDWQNKIDKEKKWNFLNTGLSSIRLLLEFDINSLTVYGFTFYRGGKGYVKHQDDLLKRIVAENPSIGYQYSPTGASHQQHKQRRFFRGYIEADPRIIFIE